MTDADANTAALSDDHVEKIAGELGVAHRQVRAVAELLDGAASVPFIARYRKELTGGLADKFIERPADVVKVLQKVTVTVLEVDLPRKRISLSRRSDIGQQKPDRGSPGQRKGQPKRMSQSKPPQGKRQQDRPHEDRQPSDRNNPFGDLLKK